MRLSDYFNIKKTASIPILERRKNTNRFYSFLTIGIQTLSLFLLIGIIGTLNQFHKKILELESNQNKILISAKCGSLSSTAGKK